MLDNAGRYYIYDDRLLEFTGSENLESGSGSKVYEVIRVIEGVPLFLEDHLARMESSLASIGMKLDVDCDWVSRQIELLALTEGCRNFNVKIIATGNEFAHYQVYISKSYYPSEAEFQNGVALGLFYWERSNPNAKILINSYKEAVSAAIAEKKAFEVLLVSSDGVITEGSKSNAFFVKEGKVLTAPGNLVLKGITRKYVFKACKNAGFEVVEEPLRMEALSSVEGLFISGTSIKVLPASRVEGMEFNSASHPAIKAIHKNYDTLISEYIQKKTSR